MVRLHLATAILPILAMAATPAAAVTYTLSGSLSTGDPTFNRPLDGNPPSSLSAVGTAVRYDTLAFTVSAAGSYSFLLNSGTGGFDTFLALYSPTFDPAASLTNILQANDDLDGSLTSSGFTRTLAAGTSYVAVLTAFSNTGLGTYSFSINGPGTVTPAAGAVPEPATWAMLVLGFGVAGAALRRRRSMPVYRSA